MKFGIFYEHQIGRPWEHDTDVRLIHDALVVEGDIVVLVCGAPLDVGGRTNLMKIHRVGDKPRLGKGRV